MEQQQYAAVDGLVRAEPGDERIARASPPTTTYPAEDVVATITSARGREFEVQVGGHSTSAVRIMQRNLNDGRSFVFYVPIYAIDPLIAALSEARGRAVRNFGAPPKMSVRATRGAR